MSIELSSEIRKTRLTFNPIIVATGRGKRPDQFQKKGELPRCPFCPGNESDTPPPEIYRIDDRSGNWKIRVVPNKFPTFKIEGTTTSFHNASDINSAIPNAHGAHEVVIESPVHETNYSEFSPEDFEHVLDVTNKRVLDLYGDRNILYIQVFKNFGDAAGASLRHEHTQIIGLPIIPLKLRNRLAGTEDYLIDNGHSVFHELLERSRSEDRIVCENENFTCLVPYEAKFPCEMWILPKKHVANFCSSKTHFDKLAQILYMAFRKLKAVFGFMPPFNAFIDEAPPRSYRNCDAFFSWRYRIMPRVTKIAGFELATAYYVNPTPPEESAKFLREASPVA